MGVGTLLLIDPKSRKSAMTKKNPKVVALKLSWTDTGWLLTKTVYK